MAAPTPTVSSRYRTSKPRDRRLSYIRHDSESAIYCVFSVYDYEVTIDPPPGYSNAKPLFGSRYENEKLYLKPMSCEMLVVNL